MSEIITIEGLPNLEQVLPDFFEPVKCSVNQPYYKECFMADYGMYCAMNGYSSMFSTDGIRTVLVKDKTGNTLMYAYVFDWEDEYTLLEVGAPQVYKVSKDKIDVEDVEYHRLPFAKSENYLFIMVRNDEDETYVQELWLRDSSTNEERKLDFPGGRLKDGYTYLQEQGLLPKK